MLKLPQALPIAKLGRFLLVGLSLTALHIGLGWLFLQLLPQQALLASILAYLGAALFGYLSQRIITFRSTTAHRLAIPRFLVMMAFGIAISAVYALILTKVLQWPPLFAVIAASITVPVFNYLAMDRLIFPDQR